MSPVPVSLRVDDRRPSTGDDAGDRPGRSSRFVEVMTTPRPRLSWIVPLVRDGQAQTGYEIRIAPGASPTDADPRSDDPGASLAWVSGPVDSAESTWIRPPLELPPYGRWRWTVRTRDEHGTWSDWAAPATLESGPFSVEGWTAQWLTAPSTSTLYGSVTLPAAPSVARLHVTAQGIYRAAVGGVVVNPGTAEPARTDPVRALCRTYDVTDLLREGDTELAITLASSHWARSGHDPRLLAELVVELPDGSTQRLVTGPGWRVGSSRVVVEEAYYLEQHDGRWTPEPDEERADAPVADTSTPLLPLYVEPDPAPPIRTVSEDVITEIGRPAPGVRVFDAGQNLAGRTRLTLRSAVAAGSEIVLVHGELVDPGGRVDTTNLKMPYDTDRHRQSVGYLSGGRPGEQVEPWFAFHGFRYVEVTGLPEDAEVEVVAGAFHSDLAHVASFDSDDPTLQRLVAAATRTQLNNAHGMPEDCPTREQAGWTGDAAATTDLALAHLDVSGFYRKWLGDLATSQLADGGIPAVSPSLTPRSAPPDPVWGSALQRVLAGHWLHYGERGLVEAHLDTLRRWVDFQLGLVRYGVVNDAPISYGHDWLGLEQTPPELLHTGAALDAIDTLAVLEDAVGDAAAASVRREQASELRASARETFHDPARGTWGNGSQGSLAVAIVAGLARPDEVSALVAQLAGRIRARGNRVTTGFAATTTLVRALAEHGGSQVLSDTIQQPKQPGVGAMLVDGPGTLWESWWIDPANTGTGSLDHIGLGGPFAGWVWTTTVGVRPTSPGFRTFVVAPAPVAGVDRASSITKTVRGTVRAGWRREGDEIVIEVEVPVGSAARIVLPGAEPVGGEPIEAGPGRHTVRAAWPEPVAVAPTSPPEYASSPFQAPARAPQPADLDGGATWLTAVAEAGSFTSNVELESIDLLPDGVNCMPVPHAQLFGPVVRVTGRTEVPADTPHVVRVSFDQPADLSAAQFVYATIDLCLPAPSGLRPELVLRVFGVDGSLRESSWRPWPAGWNRISLDVDAWDGRSAVSAVEAGVWFIDDEVGHDFLRHADAEAIPVSFHLGDLGWSAVRRTW